MKKKKLSQLALIISMIFTPPIIAALTILTIAGYYADRFNDAWKWGIYGVLLFFGPASLYVLFAYRSGKVSLTLTEREERLRPLVLALIGSVIGLALLVYKSAPNPIIILGYIVIIELIAVVFITVFWKISLHTLTLSTVVTALIFLHSSLAWVLYLLLLPVGWARIYRNRHSVLQVVAGAVIGVIVAIIVFRVTNYIEF